MVDYTRDAVERQTLGMGCQLFEIGIKEDRGMLTRDWDRRGLLGGLGFLKAKNYQGANIYVRAAKSDSSSLVLVDDLDMGAIDKLADYGLPATCVVETSPGNFQAWLRFADVLSEDALTAVSRKLARFAVGDPGSIGSRHFGRLAGFTNRKPKYEQNGKFPFCLCRSSTVNIVKAGHPLVLEARAECAASSFRFLQGESSSRCDGAGEAFAKYFREWMEHQVGNPDFSRGDWGAASRMAREGFTSEAIKQAILERSPGIADRKGMNAEKYALRTALKACGFK